VKIAEVWGHVDVQRWDYVCSGQLAITKRGFGK